MDGDVSRMAGPATTAIAGRKLRSLDGLRAIAILLVFFHHVQGYIPAVNETVLLFREYLGLGWMGVDLFFVLSGFLITGILLDTRDAVNYFSGFYVRRVLRIFPLYYFVLTAVIVAQSLMNNPQVSGTLPLPGDRWLYYCYLTNWLGLWKGHWGPNYLAHFWSLAVEEQFYLAWPLIVWLVRPRALPWVAGIVAAVAAMIRFAWLQHGGAQIAIALATVSRLDALFIGAFCAFLFRDSGQMTRIRKWLPWVAFVGVGSFLLAFFGVLFYPQRAAALLYGSLLVPHTPEDAAVRFAEYGGYTLLALGFAALVLLAAHTEAEGTWMQRFLQSRCLAPIGKYSYGIYVFHVPIIGAASIFVSPKLLREVGVKAGPAMQCGYILGLAAATFIVSAFSYEFFEKRILRFKRHFGPRYAAASFKPVPDQRAIAQTAGSA